MEYLLFFLNILFTVATAISVAGAYFLRNARKGKVFIAIEALFVIYFLDNTIVFMTEAISSFAILYDKLFLSSPVLKAALQICAIFCFLFIHKQILREKLNSVNFTLLFSYAMVLFASNFVSILPVRAWLFYAATQFFNIGLCIYGIVKLRTHPNRYKGALYKFYFKLAVFSIIMNLCIIAEDSYVIFNVDNYDIPDIFNRNISENLMVISYSFIFFRYAVSILNAHNMSVYDPVPVPAPVIPEAPPPPAPPPAIDGFCRLYSLTDREREVMEGLKEGLSINEISEKLYISVGTVKTHIHNLYGKADVNRKSDLLRKFEEFEMEQQEDKAAVK